MFRLATAIGLIAGLSFAGGGHAGTLVDREVTCPIGGESFVIAATTSCSVMGRSIALRPITSCDFITRMPICPANDLPLYKAFSDPEVERLTGFLKSHAFDRMKTQPPFLRAYGVASFLQDTDSRVGYGLMLQALWYETQAFADSPTALQDFIRETKLEVQRVSGEERIGVQLVLAYTYGLAGETEKARQLLEQLREQAPEAMQRHLNAITDCLVDFNNEDCQPDSPVKPY